MGYRHFLHTLPLCLALAVCGRAGAVERTETVECDLPDGSAFVLQARHDWAPLAVFTRHGSSRSGQGGFKVSYRARGAQALVDAGATLDYQRLDQGRELEVLCAGLGLHEGQPGTGSSLRLPGEQRFWVPAPPSLGDFGKIEQGRVDAALKQRGLRRLGQTSAMALRQGTLVREAPLFAKDAPACAEAASQACPVSAVLRMASSDRGQTWQAAGIESAPYFFKTGAALAEQAGVARPSARSLRNYRNGDANDARPLEQPCQKKCTE
ncbi:hypothetical protein HF313_26670 [Massilia atriviolacea]|uniref:Uncharacterized protein n=1 Tax=Massilia atriviolacea TaxID=2495579 RepID=A0A430HJ00_9BURK|nr:hypothetical protein [Massilia atriviolacea]RSZ57504.1 hypothetical protein EJB06_17520 [Massilia atriviolacea]